MEELISKKDLLKMTGISYGQLYRWKRKNLIPESWFIKKSSYTGQETYFPKKEILERIQIILDEKDNMDLDTLSFKFSSKFNYQAKYDEKILVTKNILKKETIEFYKSILKVSEFTFKDIFIMDIIEDLLNLKIYSFEFLNKIINLLDKNFRAIQQNEFEVICIKQNETYDFVLIKVDSLFDSIGEVIYKSSNLNNKFIEIKSLLE